MYLLLWSLKSNMIFGFQLVMGGIGTLKNQDRVRVQWYTTQVLYSLHIVFEGV